MPPQTALGRILVPRRFASLPIGGLLVELFSSLQKRFHPSDPDTMTSTAQEATASLSGKNLLITSGARVPQFVGFSCPNN